MDVIAGGTDRAVQNAGGLEGAGADGRANAGATYGPPMFPGPMAYAPVNEMGVVFLFGWMAPQLGYVVHWLQSEFPDCEANAPRGRRQVPAAESRV